MGLIIKMMKIIHKACGAQIGWFLKDKAVKGEQAKSEDLMRMDGTKVKECSNQIDFCPKCPGCGKPVKCVREMERVK